MIFRSRMKHSQRGGSLKERGASTKWEARKGRSEDSGPLFHDHRVRKGEKRFWCSCSQDLSLLNERGKKKDKETALGKNASVMKLVDEIRKNAGKGREKRRHEPIPGGTEGGMRKREKAANRSGRGGNKRDHLGSN